MMTTQKMLAAMALGLLLGVPGLATAQYSFTTIDVPGAASTAVNGNSTHAIVGEFDDADGHTHGFVWSKGVFTQIDVPGAWYTAANGVNANGDIVGIYRDDLANPSNRHGFILSKGVYTTLDGPGSARTSAFFINAKGQVVGTYRVSGKGHGFVWTNGVFTTLDVPDVGDVFVTTATGMNDNGDIVGAYILDAEGSVHGIILSKGVYTTFDVPAADGFTVGQGINNAGQIAGFYAEADGNDHGFILTKDGYTMIDVPGAFWTDVYAINATGEVVGAYEDEDGVHGFVGTPTN
jgi:probable HAF family extracellular repeat protein